MSTENFIIKSPKLDIDFMEGIGRGPLNPVVCTGVDYDSDSVLLAVEFSAVTSLE